MYLLFCDWLTSQAVSGLTHFGHIRTVTAKTRYYSIACTDHSLVGSCVFLPASVTVGDAAMVSLLGTYRGRTIGFYCNSKFF